MSSQKQTPVALLVIYDPGFKFKYKKYYLKKGNNIIGYHQNCHIQISQQQNNASKTNQPQRAANLYITKDLATIQPIIKGNVYIPSNINKKINLMVQLEIGSKYVIEMEKDFIICGRKTLMQISSIQELLQIKGIVNQRLFQINHNSSNTKNNNSNGVRQNQSKSSQKNNINTNINTNTNTNKYNNNNNNINAVNSQFQATLLIQQPNHQFQATIPINNTLQYYQATQKLQQQDMGYFEATLPLDIDPDLIPQSYQRQQPSIKMTQSIHSSINNNNTVNNNKIQIHPSFQSNIIRQKKQKQKQLHDSSARKIVSQAQISMPSTIKDEEWAQTIKDQIQMAPTIKQDNLPQPNNSIRDSNNIFAPTLQQDQIPSTKKIQQIKKKVNVMTKSVPAYRHIKEQKLQRKSQHYHSLEDRGKTIDSFQDLFGNLQNTHKSVSMIQSSSYKKQEDKNKKQKKQQKQIKYTHSDNESEKTQKLQQSEDIKRGSRQQGIFSKNFKKLNKIPQMKVQQSQPTTQKKCYLVGKITKILTQKLNKKGYQIVNQSHALDSDIEFIMIEGDVHANKIILLALIHGKQFKPISWITNQSSKLGGKLQGFLWDQILRRKGKGNKILDNNKCYYLQQQLTQQYSQVLQQAGATLIELLNKTKSRKTIYIILDQKSKEGHQLYEDWKNYKNWSFYSKKMIIESILMGEQILDKYKLDAYSF